MAGSTIANKPNLPWKTRMTSAAIGYILDWCCRPDGTVNRRLLSLLEIANSAPSTIPIDGVTSHDVIYDPSRGLWFRVYTPVQHSKVPVVIYFHGGGFFCGSPAMPIFDTYCRRVASSLPAVVVSVKYRLAPEHRFPAQFEDGFNALRYLDNDNDNVMPRCADISRCFLTGDSCGGNIAHHVTVQAVGETELTRLRVAGLVVLQPFFGGEERTESELRISAGGLNGKRIDTWWKISLPEGSNKDHEAVNIFGPNSNVDIGSLNFPPTMLVIGGFDPLKDWQMRYCNGLKDAGKQVCLVEYSNAIHGFALTPELPESDLFIEDLKAFIEKNNH